MALPVRTLICSVLLNLTSDFLSLCHVAHPHAWTNYTNDVTLEGATVRIVKRCRIDYV